MWRRPSSASTVSVSASPPRLRPPFPSSPSPQLEEESADEDEVAALSISDQRTLYLVNIFIGNTTRFLNSFVAICEEKLLAVRRRIVRLDATLTLLEARLKSADCSSVDPSSPTSSASSSNPSLTSLARDQHGSGLSENPSPLSTSVSEAVNLQMKIEQ